MSMYKLWKQYPLSNLVLTTVEMHNVLSFIKNQKRCKMFWNNFRGTICLRMLSFYLWLSNMAQKNISTKKKFQTTCFSAIADFVLCFGFYTSFELISQLFLFGFSISIFGLEPKFWKAVFENLFLLLSIKRQ